mmetsp:Transcript_79136/g.199845  ORF Transcript_79136/g.199845 Transcript_79136/m.199845 type:complete len:605 (-) Transcript_79136:9-1823(-)
MTPLLTFTAAVMANLPSGVGGARHLRTTTEDRAADTFLPVCHGSIVAETCALLGGSGSARPQDIARTLAATSDAVVDLWQTLELQGSQRGTALEDACVSICNAVARFWADLSNLPPASDVACYDAEDGHMACDLDLRPAALQRLVTPGMQLPDFHGHPLQRSEHQPSKKVRASRHQGRGANVSSGASAREAVTVKYATEDLALRVANMFRIYPALDADFVGARSSSTMAIPDEPMQDSGGWAHSWAKSVAFAQLEENTSIGCAGLMKSHCHGSCRWAWSGNWRTSCAPASQANPCFQLKKTNCMETDACIWQWSGSRSTSCIRAPSVCKGLLKRECIGRDRCQWTWTGSRNSCVESSPGPPEEGEPWRVSVEKRNRQAQAYVSTAVRKWRAKKTGPSMKKWFGKASYTDVDMRREIGRVLNSITHVLSKVDFVFLPDKCGKNTFAFVYPEGKKSHTTDGKFVFYLCPLYFGSEVAAQIETLTHEASHHSTAFTEDVCLDFKPVYMELPLADFEFEGSIVSKTFDIDLEDGSGEVEATAMLVRGDRVVLQQQRADDDDQRDEQAECKDVAYERETCERLAWEDPILAVRNADNFCFYIQDVTDAP